MKTIDFSHFIERYVAGEMGEEEKKWFDKELVDSRGLRTEVELRKKTDQVLRDQNVMNLRNKLSSIEKRRKEVAAAPQKNGKPAYIKYAAVITALAVIGSIILFTGKTSDTEDLVSQYHKTYEPPAGQRSGHSAENADFTLALEFYNTNDFANAARFFSKVVESNPKDMQSVLLNGVSNFEDKKYPEARNSFVTVIDDNNNLFIETAMWYLALCYVKTDETDKAVNQLRSVAEEKGIYSKDARKLLRQLN